MKLEIKDNSIIFSKDYATVTDVIYRLVHLYSALTSNKDKWMSKREMEFYTALILTALFKLQYDAEESDYIFDAVFGGLTIKRRKDYVSKIAKKGWIKYNEADEIVLPEIFSTIDVANNSYNVNIDFTWGI